jgi:alanine-glyoxylate transaminase/(R)-3-amino-2-methylpropionate-pyruvate transaminase
MWVALHPVLTRQHIWPAGLFHHFREPVMITEGKMQYLYDEKGRRYLDVSDAWL